MTLLRRLVLLVCCCASLAGVQTSARAAEPLPADRIVAVVNDDVITLYELNSQLDAAVRQLRKQGTPLPARDIL